MSEPVSREMRRRQFLGTAATAIGAGAFPLMLGNGIGQATESRSPSLDPPPGATWTQVLSKSDEFDGTALNTSKWTTEHWNDTSKGVVAFNPANVTVSGGRLHVAAKKEPLLGMEYTVGLVKSEFTIPGNSYTEIRAQMIPFAANVNSAIWLHDEAIAANNPNPEIDIQEYHLNSTVSNQKHIHSALHLWHKNPDIHDPVDHRDYDQAANLDLAFHLYGLERRGGLLKFYIDDVQYWSFDTATSDPALASDARPLILSCNGNAGVPTDAELPAEMLVDYVRVYTAN